MFKLVELFISYCGKLQVQMNITLPEWTKNYYPDKLIPLTLYELQLNTYNDEFRRLKGGPMVKKIIDDMIAKKENTLQPKKRKMFMYVGHDSTIISLLDTMHIWYNQMPYYNIMTIIELHEDESNWNVQVIINFQNNSIRIIKSSSKF